LFSTSTDKLPQQLKIITDDEDYDNEIEALSAFSIELVSILVTKPMLYNLIKFGTFPLVLALSNFITPKKMGSLNYFTQNDEEELLQKSVRTLAIKLINDIIEKYGDSFIQQILLVGEKCILNREDAEFLQLAQEIIAKLNFQELKSTTHFDQEAVMSFMKQNIITVTNSYYAANYS
jgi:hypothetical protein